MMKKIALRSISSSVNLARQASRALPSIFPFFMNSATNTQETANVQTEIGATAVVPVPKAIRWHDTDYSVCNHRNIGILYP
jgi:hypothetical protein